MSLTPRQALQRTIDHREIFPDEMTMLMRAIMRNEVPAPMVAALLVGLRVKKETIGEIAAAASVLREFARVVEGVAHPNLVDIVGTGGDGANTFNISTASALVASAAGARVAKHGNRGVSSASGAADVLESFGAAIELDPEQVATCIEKLGFGFMFAPIHHPALKVVAPVRKEIGIRTIFNILGPLVNPADAPNILMGVFHPDLVGIQARVLLRLGAKRALVVWGEDGVDEISLGAGTRVAELINGSIREYSIRPTDFGIRMCDMSQLQVATPTESRALIEQALSNKVGPACDVVLLNAGAALYASGVSQSIADGIAFARDAIASGAARAKLAAYVALTQQLKADG